MTAAMVAEVRRRFGVPVVVRYTSTESSLGTGTTLTSTDEEVATTVGRPVAGVELAIVDDEGDPVPAGSVGRVLLRSAAAMRGYWGRGPGRGRALAELVDADGHRGGARPGRVADAPVTSGGSPPKATCSCRAAPTSATSGAATTCTRPRSRRPCRRTPPWPGRPWSACPTTSWARSAWPWWWPRPGSAPDLASLRAHCARELSDYKAPDALVLVDELPLTPMMKVDPVRLAALAARGGRGAPAGPGAESSSRCRGARQWPHRRRRREGARMSPTTRVGESDPNRGTAPEAITPGRYAGRVAVVTGSGSGIGRATARRLAAEGAAVACLDVTKDAIESVAAEINAEAAEAGGRAIAVRVRRHRRGSGHRRGGPGRRGAGLHHQPVQHCGHRRVRPHARAVVERLGQDHRGQPDRDLPHVPGRPAGHARERRRHRQHHFDGRHEGPALFGRVLRVQGRRAAC